MTNELDTTWFDDDGELTELDESDEEDELAPTPPPPPRAPSPGPEIVSIPRPKATRATTQQATSKSRARRGLKNTVPHLKPPRTTNYSASSLFDWIQDDLVELNPEYQRGVVWNDTKQSALINSIVYNFYVPPIVFTVLRQDDGRELRVCIDGKQRLTSITRFMLGEIAYKDATSNRKAYFQSPPGAKRKLISDTLKSNFKNKQITCVEYEDLTGEQEREIFQRVQLGVTLAPADRLPAINGPYADIVRAVRRRIETTHGFELYLNWGTARGKDFQALAQFIYLILYGKESNKSEPTPARLEALLSNQASDESSLKTLETTATHVMDIFCRISYHREYGEPIRKHLSPLEFVMASYLVHLHRTKLSDSQLSEALGHMRKAFSKACPDKKSNTKNFKFILSFVQKEVVKLYGKLKPRLPSEKCADETHFIRREAVPVGQFSEKEYYAGKSRKIARKRKREDGEESDCSDDVYIAKNMKPKKEGRAQAALPAEAGSSSTANLKTESAPPTSKLKRLMNPRSAKTTVKRAPRASSSSSAAAVDRKTSVERQVGKPTVRPLSSCRTGSGSSVVSTNQPSIDPPVAKPSTNAVAGPSTSSASAPAKKPLPSLFIPKTFSKPTERPPLPTRTRVNATPTSVNSTLTPVAESADPAPAFTTAIFGTQFGSSVTPVFGQVSPLGHAQAQAQGKPARTSAAPLEEVRNATQVAPRSNLTDPFSAICSSSTTTTTSVKSPGGFGEPSSLLSNPAATKAPAASLSASGNANVAMREQDGASAAAAAIWGQGQGQGQGSLGVIGGAGTSTSTATARERKKYPNFTKMKRVQEDAAPMGQNLAGQLGSGLNQQSTSMSNSSSTAQRSASITCLANGSAHAGAAQADRVRAASMGSMCTPISTPSASPNIPERTAHWWLRQGGATSAQEEPTRDPRIVLRDATVTQTARTQQDQQRQSKQLQESWRRRAAAIKAQQDEQPQALVSSAASRTVLPSTITARRPDLNPNNELNVSPRSRANSGAAHPSKRPRTSQYPGGL